MTRSMRMITFISVLSLLLGLLASTASPTGAAPSPGCGQAVTSDFVLTADLVDCPTVGLVVGADGVHIDLNGHRITGAAHEPIECFFGGPPPGPCFGIDTDGHSGLEITNGTITGFANGIATIGARASQTQVVGVDLRGNNPNAVLLGSDNVVARNRVTSPIVVGSRSAVKRNRGSGRGGIFPFDADGVLVEHNAVPTIDARFATNTVVSRNQVSGGLIVVESRSDGSVVTRNVLVGGHIAVIGSAAVRVDHNMVLRTPYPISGIRVGFDPVRGSTDDVEVIDNLVVGAALDGIVTDPGFAARTTTIRGNVVVGNGQDGIRNGDVTATIAGNLAVHNAQLGIESVAGAVDGGGNRAAGNGDPRQCVNVVCRPG